jgi:chorismate dehydratase
VVVAHAGEMSEVEEIELDPAAQTSGNLLRCLLNERVMEARVVAPANKLCLPPATTASRAARLIIGDQAIRFRQQHAQQFQFWDLGEQWKKLTGIPFVYAIWLIRPEIAEPALVAAELRKLRDDNLTKLNAVIASQSEFEPAFCDRYYRQHLRFSLGEREIHGLRVFAELCQKYELLPEREIGLSLV